MKSIFISFFIVLLLLQPAIADDNNKLKLREEKFDLIKSDFKPYEYELNKNARREKNPLFNIDLNIQTGLTVSNTDFDVNDTSTAAQYLEETNSKLGPSIGAVLSLDVLGFGFTTGAVYSSKGFEFVSPQTQAEENVNLNYINLPLLLHFDFEAGKIMVDGNVGPYFGLMISDEENTFYKIKNFDLGLAGNLQLAYMFNKFMGVLLGSKFEYGGLNNLGNNDFINSIRTSTYHFYTGLKLNI